MEVALTISTDYDFRSPAELEQLVRAVLRADSNDENRWLEWKSSLDLTTKEAQFTIAKAVLGFANRPVEDALQFCKGTAYLVVGAEHDGTLHGVTPMDNAELGQKLKTYVGGAVRWNASSITIDGKSVLVVIVEAPRPGDDFHTLQKDFDKHYAGTIFVRHAGRTERAGPDEIRLLQERLLAGVQEPVIADIQIDTAGSDPLYTLDDSKDAVNAWIEEHRASIEDGKPDATQFANAMNMVNGNKRDRFDAEVAKHLTQTRLILPNAARQALVKSEANKLRLTVHNTSESALQSAVLRLSFRADQVEIFEGSVREEYNLPVRPRWQDIDRIAFPTHPFRAPKIRNPSIRISHEAEEITVEWTVGNLQAGQRLNSPAITVLPRSTDPNPLSVEWSISCMNRRGRQIGTITVAVDQTRILQLAIAGDPAAP